MLLLPPLPSSLLTASSLNQGLLGARPLLDLISLVAEGHRSARYAVCQGHSQTAQAQGLSLQVWPWASALNLHPVTMGLLSRAGGLAWCHQLREDSRALPMVSPRLLDILGAGGYPKVCGWGSCCPPGSLQRSSEKPSCPVEPGFLEQMSTPGANWDAQGSRQPPGAAAPVGVYSAPDC